MEISLNLPNGDVEFIDDLAFGGTSLRRIDTSGIIHQDAGGGAHQSEGPALDFDFASNPNQLKVDQAGNLYFLDIFPGDLGFTVFRYKDGQINRGAGISRCANSVCGANGPALQAGFNFGVRVPGNRTVFNIEVDREHSYRTLNDGIWAHNACTFRTSGQLADHFARRGGDFGAATAADMRPRQTCS